MLKDTLLTSLVFEAVDRKYVSSTAQVINRHDIPYYAWIHLPTHTAKYLNLVSVYDEEDNSAVEFLDAWQRDGSHPWYKIKTGSINLDAGPHMYRLEFINKYTDDMINLYFRYIIQDDNPDKPYIYMKRSV